MPATTLLEIPLEEQAQMRAVLRRMRYGYLLAGQPRKAGHPVASTSERHGLVSFPRPWHIIDVREHGFEEIGQRPPEETRCWSCPIRSVTIEVMQGFPDRVSLLRQSTMIVMGYPL